MKNPPADKQIIEYLQAGGRSLEDWLIVDGMTCMRDRFGCLDAVVIEDDALFEACTRLGAWLVSIGVEGGGADGGGAEDRLIEPTRQLETWFESWSEERLRFAETDEHRIAMAAVLRDVIGVPKEPWGRNFVDAIVTANQCQLFQTYVGQRPIEPSPELESAIGRFRDHDTQQLPEAGLWFRAALELNPDGVLTVKRSYLDRPNPDEITLDEPGVREDLKRMPRTTYWTPQWLVS